MCPNWCYCKLKVTGDAEELRRFMNHARHVPPASDGEALLDFNQFVPQPQEVIDSLSLTSSAPGSPLWYEWRIKNWGTKWEPRFDDGNMSDDIDIHGTLEYVFNTAWAPPTPVVLAMSRMFSTLWFKLRYWEGGEGFKGTYEASNGRVRTDESDEYDGSRGG